MIEIGVNLASSQLVRDAASLLQQARAAGVAHCIATGTSLEATETVVKLAGQHADVSATAGVHPHAASTWTAAVASRIEKLASSPRVVAVGECGLDYNRMFSPRQAQLEAFEAQMQLAARLDQPVFLHCRDAFEDFSAVLRNHPGVTGVVHCFTGDARQANAYLGLGMDLGITGWLADPRRGAELRDAARLVPLERLHLETDAPYLMPANMPKAERRGRNVPANLVWVASALAELRGIAQAEVVHQCTLNSRRLFRI